MWLKASSAILRYLRTDASNRELWFSMHSVKPPPFASWPLPCERSNAMPLRLEFLRGCLRTNWMFWMFIQGLPQKQRIWVFKHGRASFGRSCFFPLRNTWVNDPEPSSLPGWARFFGLDPRRSRHVKSKCFPHFPSVLVEMPTYACQASCLLKGDQVRASFWLFYFALGRWNFKAPGHFRNLWNLVPLREMMRNDPLQVTWFLIVTLHPRPSYLCIGAVDVRKTQFCTEFSFRVEIYRDE